jgi:hypothetical protein
MTRRRFFAVITAGLAWMGITPKPEPEFYDKSFVQLLAYMEELASPGDRRVMWAGESAIQCLENGMARSGRLPHVFASQAVHSVRFMPHLGAWDVARGPRYLGVLRG